MQPSRLPCKIAYMQASQQLESTNSMGKTGGGYFFACVTTLQGSLSFSLARKHSRGLASTLRNLKHDTWFE